MRHVRSPSSTRCSSWGGYPDPDTIHVATHEQATRRGKGDGIEQTRLAAEFMQTRASVLWASGSQDELCSTQNYAGFFQHACAAGMNLLQAELSHVGLYKVFVQGDTTGQPNHINLLHTVHNWVAQAFQV